MKREVIQTFHWQIDLAFTISATGVSALDVRPAAE